MYNAENSSPTSPMMMTVKEKIAKKDPESLIGRAYAFAQKAHADRREKTGRTVLQIIHSPRERFYIHGTG